MRAETMQQIVSEWLAQTRMGEWRVAFYSCNFPGPRAFYKPSGLTGTLLGAFSSARIQGDAPPSAELHGRPHFPRGGIPATIQSAQLKTWCNKPCAEINFQVAKTFPGADSCLLYNESNRSDPGYVGKFDPYSRDHIRDDPGDNPGFNMVVLYHPHLILVENAKGDLAFHVLEPGFNRGEPFSRIYG